MAVAEAYSHEVHVSKKPVNDAGELEIRCNQCEWNATALPLYAAAVASRHRIVLTGKVE